MGKNYTFVFGEKALKGNLDQISFEMARIKIGLEFGNLMIDGVTEVWLPEETIRREAKAIRTELQKALRKSTRAGHNGIRIQFCPEQ